MRSHRSDGPPPEGARGVHYQARAQAQVTHGEGLWGCSPPRYFLADIFSTANSRAWPETTPKNPPKPPPPPAFAARVARAGCGSEAPGACPAPAKSERAHLSSGGCVVIPLAGRGRACSVRCRSGPPTGPSFSARPEGNDNEANSSRERCGDGFCHPRPFAQSSTTVTTTAKQHFAQRQPCEDEIEDEHDGGRRWRARPVAKYVAQHHRQPCEDEIEDEHRGRGRGRLRDEHQG